MISQIKKKFFCTSPSSAAIGAVGLSSAVCIYRSHRYHRKTCYKSTRSTVCTIHGLDLPFKKEGIARHRHKRSSESCPRYPYDPPP